jgi:nucleoside-diphosphate-sugar epimerase
MYIDDCLQGVTRLMASDHRDPINLGTERLVTINELVDIISKIAGKSIGKRYDLDKPQGVRGRNSDNTKLRQVLGWEPLITLEQGLNITYHWIEEKLCATSDITNSKPATAGED